MGFNHPQVKTRLATASDMPELSKLQVTCHTPSFHEDDDVFRCMVEHRMSYVAEDANSPGSLVGYAMVHSIEDPLAPPCLNSAEGGSAEESMMSGKATCADDNFCVNSEGYRTHVFIHDVSVQVGTSDRLACNRLACHVFHY